jgi:hypothetical protein
MIRQWSMQGASRDGGGDERSADELRAALAPRWTPQQDEGRRTDTDEAESRRNDEPSE